MTWHLTATTGRSKKLIEGNPWASITPTQRGGIVLVLQSLGWGDPLITIYNAAPLDLTYLPREWEPKATKARRRYTAGYIFNAHPNLSWVLPLIPAYGCDKLTCSRALVFFGVSHCDAQRQCFSKFHSFVNVYQSADSEFEVPIYFYWCQKSILWEPFIVASVVVPHTPGTHKLIVMRSCLEP